MAETQEATTGYMGEFWLSTTALAAGLVEMVEVQEFDIPSGGQREQIEKTHLKSPGNRREYLSGFYEDSDFEVVLNSCPLSTTDVTTNNSSTTKHGWLAKLSNVATQYMDGTGAWSVPAGDSSRGVSCGV